MFAFVVYLRLSSRSNEGFIHSDAMRLFRRFGVRTRRVRWYGIGAGSGGSAAPRLPSLCRRSM